MTDQYRLEWAGRAERGLGKLRLDEEVVVRADLGVAVVAEVGRGGFAGHGMDLDGLARRLELRRGGSLGMEACQDALVAEVARRTVEGAAGMAVLVVEGGEALLVRRGEHRLVRVRGGAHGWIGDGDTDGIASCRFEVRPGDALVLCSDGVWTNLAGSSMATQVMLAATSELACERILRASWRSGGLDDAALVVVRVV